MEIQFIGSPNFDTTRKPIDRIIIHWFGSSGSTLASTDTYFQRKNGTSAHYGIEDNIVHAYVKEENTAYAAGNYPMNQRSISIEHSANVDRYASDETYETSAKLIEDICRRRNIPIDRTHIIKHSEVVPTSCCGTVDIDRLVKRALEINLYMNLPESLKQYSLHWKEIAIDNGFDVNAKQFEGYRNADKIISDELKDQSTKRDNQLREVGLDPSDVKGSLDKILAKVRLECQGDGWITEMLVKLWSVILTYKDKILGVWTKVRKKASSGK